MATDSPVSPSEAQRQLDSLDADRARFVAGLQTPWGLMIAAGAAMAWYVADAATAHPGAGYRPGGGLLLSVGILFVVAHLVRAETGVKFRRIGVHGWLWFMVLVGWTIAMFSAALALVSRGHRFWVAVPILSAWVVGTLGCAAVFRSCVNTARRG